MALGAALALRQPLKADIIRDRANLGRETDEGLLENVYRLQIMNMDEKPHRYRLTASGLKDIKVVTVDKQPVEVDAATTHNVFVSLQADPNNVKPGSTPVHIQVQDVDNPAISVNEKASFLAR